MSDWKTRAAPVATRQASWQDRATPVEAQAPQERGFLERAGRAVESYTRAPTRAAIGAFQDGGDIVGALRRQFGADPDTAPSGREIAERAGISGQVPEAPIAGKAGRLPVGLAPSEIAGFGIEMLADPTTLIPGIGPAAKAARLPQMAQKAGQLAKGAKAAGVKVLGKVGETFTGTPAREIETYTKNLDSINAAIKKAGGDLTQAADDTRQGYAQAIQTKRRAVNSQISESLKKAAPEANINIQPVLQKLEQYKAGINQKLNPESISEIEEIQEKIRSLTTGATEGMSSIEPSVSLGDLFDIKQFAQERAYGAYMKGGQIFMPGKESQKAAKAAASEARKILNTASPEIQKANNQLSHLHDLESKLNKSLITPGTPEGALFAAGAAGTSRSRKALERLGKAVDSDFVSEAEKLAAMRRFSNPQFTPLDATGKSMLRVAMGGTAGGAIGGPVGAAVGAAMTSPAALKAAINAGDISIEIIKRLAGGAKVVNDATIAKAFNALKTPAGQALVKSTRMPSEPETKEKRRLKILKRSER